MSKRGKVLIAVVLVAVLAVGAITALALTNDSAPQSLNLQDRFTVTNENEAGNEFTLVSENFDYEIFVNDETEVSFADYVPMDDDLVEMTKDAREVLFGRTLAEVLDGRRMVVVFTVGEDNVATSIQILFETAVNLPIEIEPIDLTQEDYD